ncbi:ribonuclease HII [Chlamydiifrater phoenicopteri]|uniref:ribonuclease HII n=1 Tax=Chlamydiifrater phoenicopteri TaxID=2681469 RepID=UPI0024849651|nr:ribonuclease HII [Chlamydiifrater phoenicopteri]
MKKRFLIMTSFEREASLAGFTVVMGVDEVGRGPLAGPVVAASCVLPSGKEFLGLDDSKKLTRDKRLKLRDQLVGDPDVCFSLGVVEVEIIDEINILEATKVAMLQAIKNSKVAPDCILVDGLSLSIPGRDHVLVRKIIKGDSLSASIAAASIIAKEYRDDLMLELHKQYPEYGFKDHKGYGTSKHLEALKKYGPSPCHRRSFSPVKEALEKGVGKWSMC